MRIFENFSEAQKELKRELKHNGLIVNVETVQDKNVEGIDDYTTKELIGYSFTVKDTSDKDNWLTSLGKNLDWAKKEFRERVDEHLINPGSAHVLRPEWDEFLHNGKFSYTYNERFREQLIETIDLLNEKPFSRQAIITMYDQHYDKKNRSGLQRIPCTMYYQFFIRENKMHMIYCIRSNDFEVHFPYDVWLAAELQRHIASFNKHVAGQVGDFIYFCGSLHAFKKDAEEIF